MWETQLGKLPLLFVQIVKARLLKVAEDGASLGADRKHALALLHNESFEYRKLAVASAALIATVAGRRGKSKSRRDTREPEADYKDEADEGEEPELHWMEKDEDYEIYEKKVKKAAVKVNREDRKKKNLIFFHRHLRRLLTKSCRPCFRMLCKTSNGVLQTCLCLYRLLVQAGLLAIELLARLSYLWNSRSTNLKRITSTCSVCDGRSSQFTVPLTRQNFGAQSFCM